VGVERFTNNAATTLTAAISSTGATSLTVASNTGFPSVTTASGDFFHVLIDTELLKVTDNSSTTWTVTRGADSSTAATHSNGATVTHVVPAARFLSSVQSTNALAHRHTVGVLASPPSNPSMGDLWTITDVSGTTAYGTTEREYAERTQADTTTNTSLANAPSNKIGGLACTIIGEGQPVVVEFYCPSAYHSVTANGLAAVLVINGVNSTFTTDNGIQSLYLCHRPLLTANVSYTFEIGKWALSAGTATFDAQPSYPMHLAVSR
jgi:hypothetical protein